MEIVCGRILGGDAVLFENVEFRIVTTQSGRLRQWHGDFELSAGARFFEPGAYRIELSDGRAGDIVANEVSDGTGQNVHVLFQGNGPLGV